MEYQLCTCAGRSIPHTATLIQGHVSNEVGRGGNELCPLVALWHSVVKMIDSARPLQFLEVTIAALQEGTQTIEVLAAFANSSTWKKAETKWTRMNNFEVFSK